MRYREIVPFYKSVLKDNPRIKVKMLHFFINTGINDTAYYWNELTKCLRIYSDLKKLCPELDSLNIGGGFPIKKSLAFDFDYAYMVREILEQIKRLINKVYVFSPHRLWHQLKVQVAEQAQLGWPIVRWDVGLVSEIES